VPEAIELSATMCIEFVYIIVGHSRDLGFDFMFERFATESRDERHIEWKFKSSLANFRAAANYCMLSLLQRTSVPDLMNFEAAFILSFVKRFRRPIYMKY